MFNEANQSEPESEQPKRLNRVENSSMICEERMAVDFINLEEDSGWLPSIEQYNGIPSLARFRFRLDLNAASDLDKSFERNRQRVTYRRKD
jgi:hypothetical protein